MIVGLSGGPDSVFLTHFFAHLHAEGVIKLIAAHLNHEWRQEARDEELFCRQLASTLGIEYVSTTISKLNLNIKFNGSKEEYGRRARRFFFNELAHTYGADRIALAHHADDQQETFFMRMLRGTTLTGLTGMKPQSGLYIRPLLSITKQEILAYLHAHGIAYCIDASNMDSSFLRNRIRSILLPALRQCDARFDVTFARLLTSLRDTERYVERVTQDTLSTIVCAPDQYGVGMSLEKLHALDPLIQDRVVMLWLHNNNVPYLPQRAFVHEIMRFLRSPRGGVHHLHDRWQLLKKRGRVYIQSRA